MTDEHVGPVEDQRAATPTPDADATPASPAEPSIPPPSPTAGNADLYAWDFRSLPRPDTPPGRSITLPRVDEAIAPIHSTQPQTKKDTPPVRGRTKERSVDPGSRRKIRPRTLVPRIRIVPPTPPPSKRSRRQSPSPSPTWFPLPLGGRFRFSGEQGTLIIEERPQNLEIPEQIRTEAQRIQLDGIERLLKRETDVCKTILAKYLTREELAEAERLKELDDTSWGKWVMKKDVEYGFWDEVLSADGLLQEEIQRKMCDFITEESDKKDRRNHRRKSFIEETQRRLRLMNEEKRRQSSIEKQRLLEEDEQAQKETAMLRKAMSQKSASLTQPRKPVPRKRLQYPNPRGANSPKPSGSPATNVLDAPISQEDEGLQLAIAMSLAENTPPRDSSTEAVAEYAPSRNSSTDAVAEGGDPRTDEDDLQTAIALSKQKEAWWKSAR
ncbi:hypothetical protein BDV95DRAFT_601434 [Massariosphaeria phaeospora]|uniref:Uncharacterized protein n=1 Tax=Massariosphaeria phaeospora TaxID=100035 RepID=A0A7C8MGK4_9PLEO|nr:hypothetical protein BDV95DRAFT_601434 [Massariosphaeria phaeospora]